MMITPDQMFAPLILACPDFEPFWQSFMDDWQPRKKRPLPYYLLLNDLARHIGRKYAAGDTDQFVAIFAVVEHWHVEGDEYVQKAASIGLLEDLQNPGNFPVGRARDIYPWLGPATRIWWDKLEDYWAKGMARYDHSSEKR